MIKVGRNDPCPCGSGKKYKKCCELKAGAKKINAQLLSKGEGADNVAAQTQRLTSSLFKRVAPPVSPPAEEQK